MLDDMIVVGIPFVILAVILVFGMTFWARYRTAGPDEAMIITGSFLAGGSVITDESNRRIKKESVNNKALKTSLHTTS